MKAFFLRLGCWICCGHLWMPAGTLILSGRVMEECPHCHAVRARRKP